MATERDSKGSTSRGPSGARRSTNVSEVSTSALVACVIMASCLCPCDSFSLPHALNTQGVGARAATSLSGRAGCSIHTRQHQAKGPIMYAALDRPVERTAEQVISAYTGAGEELNDLQLDMIMLRSYLKLDQRIRHSADRMSPLMAAVTSKKARIAKVLITLGANIEERNDQGQTPLMVSAMRGDSDTVKLLLANGASALARDVNGDTALIHAARVGEKAVVELLRKPAMSLHHLYSPPHFKAFLWMTGAGMFDHGQEVSGERLDQVREIVMTQKAIPLCKMNLDMVSLNAALRLDQLLGPPHEYKEQDAAQIS